MAIVWKDDCGCYKTPDGVVHIVCQNHYEYWIDRESEQLVRNPRREMPTNDPRNPKPRDIPNKPSQ